MHVKNFGYKFLTLRHRKWKLTRGEDSDTDSGGESGGEVGNLPFNAVFEGGHWTLVFPLVYNICICD